MSRVSSVGLIYGTSILALFLGELLLSTSVEPKEFASYSLVRAALPLVVAIGLLGFDQALTRESAATGSYPRFGPREAAVSFRATIAALSVCAYLFVALDLALAYCVSLAIAALGVSVTNLVSGVLRAARFDLRAAFIQQGHRLIAGVIIAGAAAFIAGPASAAILAGSAALVAIIAILWSRNLFVDTDSSTSGQGRLVARLGLSFTIGMITLSAADWLDQVLVAQSADLTLAGIYSQTKLVVVYPLLSLGSIVGFLALPWAARRRSSWTASSVTKIFMIAGFLSVTAASCGGVLAYFALGLLFNQDYSFTLIATLAAYAAVRLFYVVPSALSGAISSTKQLAVFGLSTTLTLPVQAGIFCILYPFGILEAASVGVTTGFVARAGLAVSFTYLALKGKTHD